DQFWEPRSPVQWQSHHRHVERGGADGHQGTSRPRAAHVRGADHNGRSPGSSAQAEGRESRRPGASRSPEGIHGACRGHHAVPGGHSAQRRPLHFGSGQNSRGRHGRLPIALHCLEERDDQPGQKDRAVSEYNWVETEIRNGVYVAHED
ncbi:unnamed protein product, partial [Prorocentrum cordatum]